MSWRWDFWRRDGDRPRRGANDSAAHEHLERFIATRQGVEVFLEPATTMTRPSLLLIASDGEWTRRSIESSGWGRRLAERHALPVYDAAVVGYPQRMRDYNERRKRER